MGLERVTQVARALGTDRLACPVITVAGTNGKGSTAAHLEAIALSCGLRPGMFTSPHFLRYNERIRVAGTEADDAELIEAFERIERARGATTLTFFEYNTLAALLIFAARGVDLAILEVGLGGRLDATNLLDADVGIVCSIGFDHRDWLGSTLEEIGAEKAGIFRAGRPAVLGTSDMPRSVFAAIERLGARPVVAMRDFNWSVHADATWDFQGPAMSFTNLPPSALAGSIQYRNASTALAALGSLEVPPRLSGQTVRAAMQRVRLAGRLQIVDRDGVEWILDIAHNEPAAKIFAGHVRERAAAPGGRTLAVVGILGDKDAREIGRELEPMIDHWFLAALPGPRGGSAQDLAKRLALEPGTVTLSDSVELACQQAQAAAARGDRVLVFGSVYTVGPALRWLRIY